MVTFGHREDVEVARQHPRDRRGRRSASRPRRCACSSSARTTARRSTSPPTRLDEAQQGARPALRDARARRRAARAHAAPSRSTARSRATPSPFETDFCAAMDDDLNAAKAHRARLRSHPRPEPRARRRRHGDGAPAIRDELARVGPRRRALRRAPARATSTLRRAAGQARAGLIAAEIEAAIQARNDARKRQDFQEADAIRARLQGPGHRARGRSGRHDLEGRLTRARGAGSAVHREAARDAQHLAGDVAGAVRQRGRRPRRRDVLRLAEPSERNRAPHAGEDLLRRCSPAITTASSAVSVGPGQTQFTVMPCRATSRASAFEKPITPALHAE